MLIQGAKLGKLVGDQLTITIPLHTVEELKKFKPDDLCQHRDQATQRQTQQSTKPLHLGDHLTDRPKNKRLR